VKAPAGVLCSVLIVPGSGEMRVLTPWTVTTVWLRGGFREQWANMLADCLASGEPIRSAWVELLVRDWIADTDGLA